MTLAIGTTWWDRLMRLWFAVTARARTATALLRTPTALLDDCCCCFELTDCDGVAPDLLVDNNLSASVGKVVDVGGVCYQVATAADCTGATTEAIVATHDTCAECSPTCYDLHDCRDAAPGKKVDNDLSMVGSVKIGGTCYQVDEAPDCVGATTETIAETHDNCVECETGGQGEFCKDRCGLGVEAPTAFIVTLSGLSVCDECHLDAQAGVYVIFEGDPNGTYLLPEREPFGPCSWRLTIDGAGHPAVELWGGRHDLFNIVEHQGLPIRATTHPARGDRLAVQSRDAAVRRFHVEG